MKIFTASSSTPLRELTTSVKDSAKFALASDENRKKAPTNRIINEKTLKNLFIQYILTSFFSSIKVKKA